MVKKFEYQTRGVCSSKIILEVKDNVIERVEFVGGCPGNTEGVSRLCVGKTLDEVVSILAGIDCRGRGTSCPDQLAKACLAYKNSEEALEYADSVR